MEASRIGKVVDLPVDPASMVDIALDELEGVYGYLYRRVGNRADAEDLTQQVALKAIPRLNHGSLRPAIRAYLFATARTELATFWAKRFGLPVEQLHEEIVAVDIERGNDSTGKTQSARRIERILRLLPSNYARLLELRFLRGYSTREVAAELGMTAGAVRVMQLRALRAAAKVARDD
jgi:RNA polymerase sigma factor (sigma-70 family)